MRRFLVLLLAATACGEDGSHQLPDARLPPDAAIDAAPDTLVTITITAKGEPRPGVEVYFVNPDDSLVTKATTDANGVASAVVLAGASVTAVDPFPERPQGGSQPERQLRTFIGVKPGDDLQLTERWFRGFYLSVEVNLPLAEGADTYKIDSTCSDPDEYGGAGSATPPSYRHYMDDCGGTADFVVEAFSEGTPVGWFTRDNVAFEDGGTLDFTSASYQPLPEVTVTFENVPAAFRAVHYMTSLWNARGALWEPYYSGDAEMTNGTGVATFPRPSIAGTRAITTVRPTWNGSSTDHEIVYSGDPGMTTFDLDGAFLHDFTDRPTYDPVTRKLAWSASTTGTAPDYATAYIYVEQAVGKGYEYYDWEIVAPYATSRVLPKLPDEALPFTADGTTFANAWLVVTVKVPGGYDAVRERVFATESLEALAAGTSGRISSAEFGYGLARARTPVGKAQLQRAAKAEAKAAARARRAANRR